MRKSDLIYEALDEFVNQYQPQCMVWLRYHNVISDDYDEAGDCIGVLIRIIDDDDNSYFVNAAVDGDDIYIDISEDN